MEISGGFMNDSLNPWYITGIVEGEGSFCVSFTLKERLSVKIETRPSFSITLTKKDFELLKKIKDFFGCGFIRYSKGDRTYKYEVRAIKELVKIIIPHFQKYPLMGIKNESFKKFTIICEKVYANLHLNKKNLREIIEIAYDMNYGKRKYSREYLLKLLGEVKV